MAGSSSKAGESLLPNGEPTVRDHLVALGEPPEWVISLGEAILGILDCDVAIAAMRARDISNHPEIARGFEQVVTGWRALMAADWSRLTPMQAETAGLILAGMHKGIQDAYAAGAAGNPIMGGR